METQAAAPTSTSPRVYVVDDDESLRHSMTWMLEGEGFAVQTFQSGVEFIERHGSLPEGCVLLDLRMPALNGLEVVERLRDAGFAMPIIMLTAFGEVPDAVRALKAGVCDFFQKPFTKETLLGSIHAALEGQRQQNQRRKASALRDQLLDRLTEREKEILHHLLLGKRSKQIARELDLSAKTVENHRGNIMAKLGVDSLAELARLYWADRG